jgi:hypothetical protein
MGGTRTRLAPCCNRAQPVTSHRLDGSGPASYIDRMTCSPAAFRVAAASGVVVLTALGACGHVGAGIGVSVPVGPASVGVSMGSGGQVGVGARVGRGRAGVSVGASTTVAPGRAGAASAAQDAASGSAGAASVPSGR